MDAKIKNHLYLTVFCLLIGSFAGAVIWLFLKLLSIGTVLLWEVFPEWSDISIYPLLLCTIGALLVGLIRKHYGDYPEELDVVLGTLKRTGRYEYRNMAVLLLTALLPLLIGSSVGPEAGMTGIIVGLCCWVGENLKFARQHAQEYTRTGMVVTLGVLFHSPLFGIFAVEEADEESGFAELSRSSKLLLYGLALAAAAGIYLLLSTLFGTAMEGFPSFPAAELTGVDYPMIPVYILCGCILAKWYQLSHKAAAVISGKLPGVLKEAMAGLLLGLTAMAAPALLFSGEEQMGELMTGFASCLPLLLILGAFLKVLLTNICIQFGLKGGHFFPLIFAGACLGYGLAGWILPGGAHEVFAAAVVTAASLGGIMKKPLAVTMLLFLCFPIRMFVWIFLAAAIGAKLCVMKSKPHP